MCSIIAAIGQKELDLAFLENRDKPKELFIGNDVRKVGDVIGVYDFRARGMACGYSVKSGTAGGVANILGYSGEKSRGVLILSSLQEGSSAEDAAKIIKEQVATGRYGSASYILCDPKSIITIESFGTRVHSSKNSGRKKIVVTTNHFHNLHAGKRPENSVLREKYLQELGTMTEERILNLATRHRNPAICRHGRTLASFAVFKKYAEKPRILYSVAEPCRGYNEFRM